MQNQINMGSDVSTFAEDAKRIAQIIRTLPNTFSEALKEHMRRERCTVEQLAEQSQLSPKTIQRWRNEAEEPNSIQAVLAVCFGLKLHPVLSRHLVSAAGFKFKSTEEHIVYEMLLYTGYKISLQEINDHLATHGYVPLGYEKYL
jgi:hypothetical protein